MGRGPDPLRLGQIASNDTCRPRIDAAQEAGPAGSASDLQGGNEWDRARSFWASTGHEARRRHTRPRGDVGQDRAGQGAAAVPACRQAHDQKLRVGRIHSARRLGAPAAGRARELGLLQRRGARAAAGLQARRHRRAQWRGHRRRRAAVSRRLSHRHAAAGAPARDRRLGARALAAARQLPRHRHRLAHVGQLQPRFRAGAVGRRLRARLRRPPAAPGAAGQGRQKRAARRQEPRPLGGGAGRCPRPAQLQARHQRAARHAGSALLQSRSLPGLAARQDRLLLPPQDAQRQEGAHRVPLLDRRPRGARSPSCSTTR